MHVTQYTIKTGILGVSLNNTMNNTLNLPSELSLVKNVGDLKLISGNRTTIRNKGTVRYCFHTRSNTELSTAELLASGRKHCTAFQHIHKQHDVMARCITMQT